MKAYTPTWSFSRLDRFARCPLSYKLQYVDRKRGEPNDAMRFGSLLHTALESLYQTAVDEEISEAIQIDAVDHFYMQAWSASGLGDPALFQEGREIMHKYAGVYPVIDHRNVLAVEQRFLIEIGPYKVQGFIDRIDRMDDDTIAVLDYKSNRMLYTSDELDASLQLSIYYMAARELYPWAKNIRLGMIMLRHGITQETERDADDIEAARQYVIATARAALSTKKFEPRLGNNCQWCDHRGNCPAYAAAIAGDVEPVGQSLDPDKIEELAEERARVAALAKIYYGRQREIDEVIKERIGREGEFEAGGHSFRISKTTSTKYPVYETLEKVIEITGMDADEAQDRLLVVEKKKVDKLIKDLRKEAPDRVAELRMELADVAKQTYSNRLYAKPVKS